MEKPIDNSDRTTSKTIQLDPLSDTNESNPIIDSADEFVLFPLDVQETKSDTTKADRNFTLQKKMSKRSIVNRKANRMLVSHPEFKEPIEFLYFKNISNKYSTFYTEMPGLPVRFSVPTADGTIDYELIKMSEYSPNHDLFGVPSDYKLVTFDEFLEKMISKNGQIEE